MVIGLIEASAGDVYEMEFQFVLNGYGKTSNVQTVTINDLKYESTRIKNANYDEMKLVNVVIYHSDYDDELNAYYNDFKQEVLSATSLLITLDNDIEVVIDEMGTSQIEEYIALFDYTFEM